MKIIAHRGASLDYPENSMASLLHAAQLGADVVECDVRLSADQIAVIMHDPDLKRFTGLDLRVDQLSLAQLDQALKKVGRAALTLAEVLAETELDTLLLHLKITPLPDYLLQQLAQARHKIICGVQSLVDLKAVKPYFAPERILGFVPEPGQIEEFISNGAGIIRLWEQWLDDIQPARIKAAWPVEVWIMSNKDGSMDGNLDSLARFRRLEADGVLLNDIKIAL